MEDHRFNSGEAARLDGQSPPHSANGGTVNLESKVINTHTSEGLNGLWLPTGLGDGITDGHWHNVPFGKPRDFFRVNADKAYIRQCEIYVHKKEDEIGEDYYPIGPKMRGKIEEARPCTLVTCIYRDGTPRIWPLILPRNGEKDNAAWSSARKAARDAMSRWVKLVWRSKAYFTRDALKGYAPEPDWSKLPPFEELITVALGEHGIIRDKNHPIYRELMGAPEGETESDTPDLALGNDDLGELA
jgi:hypothetical protein